MHVLMYACVHVDVCIRICMFVRIHGSHIVHTDAWRILSRLFDDLTTSSERTHQNNMYAMNISVTHPTNMSMVASRFVKRCHCEHLGVDYGRQLSFES